MMLSKDKGPCDNRGVPNWLLQIYTPLQSWWRSCFATCTDGVFPCSISTFTDVRTNTYVTIATCTMGWGGGGCLWWTSVCYVVFYTQTCGFFSTTITWPTFQLSYNSTTSCLCGWVLQLTNALLTSSGAMAKPTSYSLIPVRTSPGKPVTFNGSSVQPAIRPKVISMDKVIREHSAQRLYCDCCV